MDMINDEKYVAVLYKKTRVVEDLYVFRISEILYGVAYDGIKDTITYNKNGTIKVMPNMENYDFITSSCKYCYSDLFTIQELMSMFECDKEEAIKELAKQCSTFIRFGVIDRENNSFKIINTDVHNMKKLDMDDFFEDYYLSYDSNDKAQVYFPINTLKTMLKYINENDTEVVKDFFETILKDYEEVNNLTNGSCNGLDFKVTKEVDDLDDSFIDDEDDDDELLDEDMDKSVEENKDNKNEIKLDDLIGLDNIKLEIQRLKNYLIFQNKIKDVTNIKSPNLNMVFYGNPGTGKTTVARIIASMLHELGYTKNDKFGELTIEDFVAGYVGQTAIKSRKVLKKYKGGVIFIDEAYAFNSEGQQYAEEAIAEILKEMERKETIFIFAGYKDEMKNFINMNPGIESRIGYHLNFKDYTLDELYEIFKTKIESSGLKLQDGIDVKVKAIISNFINKDKFGNGRFIDNLFQKIIMHHADRLVSISDVEILTTIENLDLDEDILKELETNDTKKKIIGF